MFTFEKRDDGFLAVHEKDGRSVAHVETTVLGETNDPRFKVQEQTKTPLPVEKWQVHFTAVKLTPPELQAFVEELIEQQAEQDD